MDVDEPRTDRRSVLKKAAVAGGIVWAAPVLVSATTPAAAGTPPPVPPEVIDIALQPFSQSIASACLSATSVAQRISASPAVVPPGADWAFSFVQEYGGANPSIQVVAVSLVSAWVPAPVLTVVPPLPHVLSSPLVIAGTGALGGVAVETAARLSYYCI